MKKEEKFIKAPNYPGGMKALSLFIKRNLCYPKDAIENKVEGTVVITIDIDKHGKVIRGRVKHGLGSGCDEEALRVCKLLKFESVKNRGVKVTFHRTLNIPFKLPIIQKIPANIKYTINNTSGNKVTIIKYNIVPPSKDNHTK
ncbi:MAG: energy transducer TonB [Bacteroidia bacterium]|nr:energy transducer TonB [Bacteroidia bacterium]